MHVLLQIAITQCTAADLLTAECVLAGARNDQAPAVEARTPQLFAAFKTLSNLAAASVQVGPSATLALVSSGAFTALVQVCTSPSPALQEFAREMELMEI